MMHVRDPNKKLTFCMRSHRQKVVLFSVGASINMSAWRAKCSDKVLAT